MAAGRCARNRALTSCPGRAKRDPGPRGGTTARFNCPSILPCSPWVPALRSLTLARPGHESTVARDSDRPSVRCTPTHLSNLTMSNSAVFFVPAARLCARVCLYPFAPFPNKRGGRSADRRTCVGVARARRDHPRSVRRGASHDAGRSPLGAPPWRFWAGGRASISGIASGSVQRAPRSQVVVPGGRGPGPPESAGYEPRPQDATPRSAFRIVSRRRPYERGCESIAQLRYVVNRKVRM